MAEPEYRDVTFPLGGIDRTGEVGQQSAATCHTGVNVRGTEPSTLRERGGSRCGLKRFIPTRIGNTAEEIQHLGVVVHVSGEATLASWAQDWFGHIYLGTSRPPYIVGDPLPGSIFKNITVILDPTSTDDGGGGTRREGDRYIRDGGSGVTPNKNIPSDGSGSDRGWEYIQSAQDGIENGDTITVAYGTPVTRHNLLVVCISCHGGNDGSAPNFTISDTLGNTYQLAGRSDNSTPGTQIPSALIYWCRSENGGANTVTITQTGYGAASNKIRGAYGIVLEYGGLETTTPFEDSEGATGSFTGAVNESHATGAMVPGGNDRLALGLFTYSMLSSQYTSLTPHADFTERKELDTTSDPDLSYVTLCTLLEDLSSDTAPNPRQTMVGSFGVVKYWAAVGATFRWGI